MRGCKAGPLRSSFSSHLASLLLECSLQGWAEQAAAGCIYFKNVKFSCLHLALIPEDEEVLHRGKTPHHTQEYYAK